MAFNKKKNIILIESFPQVFFGINWLKNCEDDMSRVGPQKYLNELFGRSEKMKKN